MSDITKKDPGESFFQVIAFFGGILCMLMAIDAYGKSPEEVPQSSADRFAIQLAAKVHIDMTNWHHLIALSVFMLTLSVIIGYTDDRAYQKAPQQILVNDDAGPADHP